MKLRTVDKQNSYTVERLIGQKTGLLQQVEFGTRCHNIDDVIIARIAASTDPEDLGITGISADLTAVGKGTTKQEALQSVIGEYVERYCAFTGFPKSVQSQGSYETMANSNLQVPDFSTITHYLDIQYSDTDAEPLSPDTQTTWIMGTGLISGKKTALPSWIASSRNLSPHGFGSSNGCAAGQSLTRAAYRGLLEVIERDALMRHWYTKTVPKRVQLDSSTLQMLRDRHEPTNSRIELLSLESDFPFKIIAATLIGVSDSHPKFLISASARLRLEDAVADAIMELSQQIQMYRRHTLVTDDNVQGNEGLSLGKNGLYYTNPENFKDIEWLVTGDVTSLEPSDDSIQADDNTRLDTALEAFRRTSTNVILYETTNPEIKEIGLHAVKVVVPELAPFCHPEKPAAGHDRLPNAAVHCEPHPIP